MQSVTMYIKGCTRSIRFINQTELSNYLYTQQGRTLDIEGCVITDTTGYFDFKSPFRGAYRHFQQYSYLKIDLKLEATEDEYYYAFIDKIELNNFSGDDEYYRCYFTIDWWSTLNTRNEFETIIEGEVERAHINDVVLNTNTGKWVGDLTNILPETEEPVILPTVLTFNPTTTVEGLQWAYIVLTSANEWGLPTSPNIIPLRSKISSSITPCVVVPVKSGVIQRFICTNSEDIGDVNFRSDNLNFIGDVTDGEAYSIFYSKIPPCAYREGNLSIEGNAPEYYIQMYPSNSAQSLDEKYLEFGGIIIQQQKTVLPSSIPHTVFNIDDLLEGSPLYVKNEYVIPQNYAEYLSNNIVKFHSATYKPVIYRCGGEVRVIETRTMLPNTNIYINVDIGTGGSYISYANLLRSDMSLSTFSVGKDCQVKPPRTVNSYDVTKAILNLAINSSTSVGTAVATKSPKSIGGAINTTLNGTWGAIEALVGTNNGLASFQQQDYSVVDIDVVYSVPSNSVTILEHLARYGYYTDLHPNDILQKHKRKYFNYIKTVNCKILSTYYNESVRKQIEDMFNSGVWLWNTTDEFGNFEVPNYPLIMEETNQ